MSRLFLFSRSLYMKISASVQASTPIAMTSHNLSALYDTPLEAIWHDNKLVVYAL
ncbi:hypothetical protein JP0246_11600 [Helicobacter pylori]